MAEGMFDLRELLALALKKWKMLAVCIVGGGVLFLLIQLLIGMLGGAMVVAALARYAFLGCLFGLFIALFINVLQFFFGKKAYSVAWFEDRYVVDSMTAGEDIARRAFCYIAGRTGGSGTALLLSTIDDTRASLALAGQIEQNGYSVCIKDIGEKSATSEKIQPGKAAETMAQWHQGSDYLILRAVTPCKDLLAVEIAADADVILFTEKIGESSKTELDTSLHLLAQLGENRQICLVWADR